MKETDEHVKSDKSTHDDRHSVHSRMTDNRIATIAGVVLLLISAYFCIVSVSYFSHATADQSLVENRTIEYLTHTSQSAEKISNTGGPIGAWISHNIISGWLGLGSFILIFYLISVGLALLRVCRIRFWSLTMKCLIAAITVSMLLGLICYSFASPIYWGGEHGFYMNKLLVDASGIWGALGVNILLVLVTLMIFYNDILASYRRYRTRYIQQRERLQKIRLRRQKEETENKRIEAEKKAAARRERKVAAHAASSTAATTTEAEVIADTHAGSSGSAAPDPLVQTPEVLEIKGGDDDSGEVDMIVKEAAQIEQADSSDAHQDVYDPTAELSRYRFPSLDLLHQVEQRKASIDQQTQEDNKRLISEILAEYNIGISKIEATVGPTVTLYEIIPSEGIRIAKIKRLEDDIAMKLSALGIRIIAPIPGRGTIGLEVPNKDPQMVPIRQILSSKAYVETKMALPMAMGATIEGDVYIADLTKMPHLLVAGATGMGKSVGLNTIIASLLYKKHPAELKFVLIDPKMVEFSLYSKLERHYLAKLEGEDDAIITDPKKVVNTLNSLCVEMDNRYQLLKLSGDRNIKEYNKRFTEHRLNPEKGHRYLPYIVVVVDEFADLIMTAGKEVETPVARIAQKARAVGIHMILATQRPSTNVITGIIKANFPGRVAFRVTQMVDSRTILDRPGANQLIGRGDMLFSVDGNITRVQCAFIDTDEVEAICDCIDDQVGYEAAYPLPEYIPETDGGADGAHGGNNFGERDPLFNEAARAVVTSGLASTSSLQRRYSIGYNRAGKIMDQMEAAGIVGPSQGGKARQVLVDIVTLESLLGS